MGMGHLFRQSASIIMAITYTLYEGAAAVAALEVGTLVAHFETTAGGERNFIPSNTPESGDAASLYFPAITAISRVTDSAGGVTGPVNLRLAPGVSDLINISPMAFTLDQDVSLTTASGTF